MEKLYTCPMHPEIRSSKPGNCPICHMQLVNISDMRQTSASTSYAPLLVVISLIVLVTVVLTGKDILSGVFLLQKTITYFMIGFFLVFSGFKLMDVKGFAQGYATYDLLAKRWIGYGYLYPFIELGFGIAMIINPYSQVLLVVECIIMVFSGIGVVDKLRKHEKFQCACLGTFMKVPLTNITLIEDFGMAALALLMLIIK